MPRRLRRLLVARRVRSASLRGPARAGRDHDATFSGCRTTRATQRRATDARTQLRQRDRSAARSPAGRARRPRATRSSTSRSSCGRERSGRARATSPTCAIGVDDLARAASRGDATRRIAGSLRAPVIDAPSTRSSQRRGRAPVRRAGRHRARRAAADGAELGHRAGRGSLRGDDAGRSREDGRVLVPAGSRVRGVVTRVKQGRPHRAQGQPDAQLRSGHGQRPHLSDSRHGDQALESERLSAASRTRSAPAPASARSSAAFSAASRARSPAS